MVRKMKHKKNKSVHVLRRGLGFYSVCGIRYNPETYVHTGDPATCLNCLKAFSSRLSAQLEGEILGRTTVPEYEDNTLTYATMITLSATTAATTAGSNSLHTVYWYDGTTDVVPVGR
jgi:hypothetical protein